MKGEVQPILNYFLLQCCYEEGNKKKFAVDTLSNREHENSSIDD